MATTQTTIERLSLLRNYATRYEAICVSADARRALVAYSGRHSFQGLVAAVRRNGAAVAAFLGLDDTAIMSRKGARLAFSNGAMIEWSDRTQRQAIMEGELPWVGAIVAAAAA